MQTPPLVEFFFVQEFGLATADKLFSCWTYEALKAREYERPLFCFQSCILDHVTLTPCGHAVLLSGGGFRTSPSSTSPKIMPMQCELLLNFHPRNKSNSGNSTYCLPMNGRALPGCNNYIVFKILSLLNFVSGDLVPSLVWGRHSPDLPKINKALTCVDAA